ncbi:hypothetical protein LZ31DRAFT_182188 [Colletotrichum somersetense]|nr:hypothetical protein LZ31DRAFT_182188 [Colletotrichum somersetense]
MSFMLARQLQFFLKSSILSFRAESIRKAPRPRVIVLILMCALGFAPLFDLSPHPPSLTPSTPLPRLSMPYHGRSPNAPSPPLLTTYYEVVYLRPFYPSPSPPPPPPRRRGPCQTWSLLDLVNQQERATQVPRAVSQSALAVRLLGHRLVQRSKSTQYEKVLDSMHQAA